MQSGYAVHEQAALSAIEYCIVRIHPKVGKKKGSGKDKNRFFDSRT